MILIEENRQVKFHEADPQGYLFYGRVFTWAHDALELFWNKHQKGWTFWFANPEWAVPLRHVEADYRAPLRTGKTYSTSLALEKVGNTSVTLKFVVRGMSDAGGVDPVRSGPSREGKSDICAIVTTTHVFIDKRTEKPIEVPSAVREVFGIP